MAIGAYDAWRGLLAKINEELIRHEAVMTGGALKTLEAYREEFGYIRALRDTASWAQAIVRNEEKG